MSDRARDIRPEDPSSIRAMFERLAPDYDRLNTVLTLGRVRSWQRALVRAAGIEAGDRVLDVCAGTGRTLRAVTGAVGSLGTAVGVDFTWEMLRRARGVRVLGDALRLPFADAAFDAAVSAFALRDVADQAAMIAEMGRVVRPGGTVGILEVGRPDTQPFRLGFDVWFRGVVPGVASVFGQGRAHAFLVRSVSYLPKAAAMDAMLTDGGLEVIMRRSLTMGAARIVVARRRG